MSEHGLDNCLAQIRVKPWIMYVNKFEMSTDAYVRHGAFVG